MSLANVEVTVDLAQIIEVNSHDVIKHLVTNFPSSTLSEFSDDEIEEHCNDNDLMGIDSHDFDDVCDYLNDNHSDETILNELCIDNEELIKFVKENESENFILDKLSEESITTYCEVNKLMENNNLQECSKEELVKEIKSRDLSSTILIEYSTENLSDELLSRPDFKFEHLVTNEDMISELKKRGLTIVKIL